MHLCIIYVLSGLHEETFNFVGCDHGRWKHTHFSSYVFKIVTMRLISILYFWTGEWKKVCVRNVRGMVDETTKDPADNVMGIRSRNRVLFWKIRRCYFHYYHHD